MKLMKIACTYDSPGWDVVNIDNELGRYTSTGVRVDTLPLTPRDEEKVAVLLMASTGSREHIDGDGAVPGLGFMYAAGPASEGAYWLCWITEDKADEKQT